MLDHTYTLSSGRKLGYSEHGDASGSPLIFLHGWPSSRLQGVLLDTVGKSLRLRVICPDRPGIGISDPQPGRTLLDWPDTLRELAAGLGFSRFHLAGWSGGGPYVLATALKAPELLISATVLCGAPPLTYLGHKELFWPYRMLIRMRRSVPALLGTVLSLGERLTRGEPTAPPLKWILGMLEESDRKVLSDPVISRGVHAATVESMRQGPQSVVADADLYLSDWGFNISDISYLVHLWHGKEDRNIPWTYSVKMAEAMPNTTTHWLDNEGHYSLPVNRAEEALKHALERS